MCPHEVGAMFRIRGLRGCLEKILAAMTQHVGGVGWTTCNSKEGLARNSARSWVGSAEQCAFVGEMDAHLGGLCGGVVATLCAVDTF